MKVVTLNQREQARLQVLNSVLECQLDRAQTAEIMGIGERQLRRNLAAYRREGAAALFHGNRDWQPRNTVPEEVASAGNHCREQDCNEFMGDEHTLSLKHSRGLKLGRISKCPALGLHAVCPLEVWEP